MKKTPDDVYAMAETTQGLIRGLMEWTSIMVVVVLLMCAVVVVLIIFNVRHNNQQEKRVNKLARIAEGQANVTDRQQERVEQAAGHISAKATEAVTASREVAAATAAVTVKKSDDLKQFVADELGKLRTEVGGKIEAIEKKLPESAQDWRGREHEKT